MEIKPGRGIKAVKNPLVLWHRLGSVGVVEVSTDLAHLQHAHDSTTETTVHVARFELANGL